MKMFGAFKTIWKNSVCYLIKLEEKDPTGISNVRRLFKYMNTLFDLSTFLFNGV